MCNREVNRFESINNDFFAPRYFINSVIDCKKPDWQLRYTKDILNEYHLNILHIFLI